MTSLSTSERRRLIFGLGASGDGGGWRARQIPVGVFV